MNFTHEELTELLRTVAQTAIEAQIQLSLHKRYLNEYVIIVRSPGGAIEVKVDHNHQVTVM